MSAHGAGPGGPGGGGPGGPGAGDPSEEELRAALEEQMRRLTVEDVVVQTVITLVNLSARKLALGMPPEQAATERDLDQARLGIEATRALLPVVPGDVAPIRDALSQLQIAYAREAGGVAAAGAAAGQTAAESAAQPPDEQAAPEAAQPAAEDEAERAKARAKIWTPPGA